VASNASTAREGQAGGRWPRGRPRYHHTRPGAAPSTVNSLRGRFTRVRVQVNWRGEIHPLVEWVAAHAPVRRDCWLNSPLMGQTPGSSPVSDSRGGGGAGGEVRGRAQVQASGATAGCTCSCHRRPPFDSPWMPRFSSTPLSSPLLAQLYPRRPSHGAVVRVSCRRKGESNWRGCQGFGGKQTGPRGFEQANAR
jgi:hypothetical protein